MIGPLLKGLGVTFRQMFAPRQTVEYPDEKRPVAERFRGRHELKRYENGLERCIGCSLCSAACPADAILVVPAENRDEARYSPGERYAEVYEINMLRCIFCGFCEEACPTDAIVLEHEYELSSHSRRDLIYTKEMLLVPPAGGAAGTPRDTRGERIPFRMGGMDYFVAPIGVAIERSPSAHVADPGAGTPGTSSAPGAPSDPAAPGAPDDADEEGR